MGDLRGLLQEHRADPFPTSVEKGEDYGEVEPVTIDADIFGWADGVADGGQLSPFNRRRLRLAREELARSLAAFPKDAQPYFARLIAIADMALT